MDIYWYWPYLRQEELALADGVLRHGDHLAVHCTPRPLDPISSSLEGCEVLPALPGVDERSSEGSISWGLSRASTYIGRARSRHSVLKGETFDVAHIIYLNPFVDWLALRSLARRVPLVSTVHDVTPHQRRMPTRVERSILAREYANAGTIVVHHEWVGERLSSEFDVDPARINYIPLPVLPPPPIVDDGVDDDGVDRGGVDDGVPEILFFGTLRRNKGVEVLLNAVRLLPTELQFRLVIAGRGFAEVEQLVRDAASRDKRIVAEVGYATAERKAALYARCSVNVLPYTSFESQSAVLQDAYANSVPLIVSDVGALGSTVRSEGTGWVVPPSDAKALAEAIIESLRDDPAAKQAGANMAKVAAQRTPALVGASLRRLYEEVAGAPQ
ncbi:glycosyltransferase [Actinobacteria bacterium IMCC26256]|nr:glycosyltransferase [Actinobacteria bacterium IMCC26256]